MRAVAFHPFPHFEGTFLRSGSAVDEAKLRPAPEWPETPLLIEFAGKAAPGRDAADVHILWRWSESAGQFEEIARVFSQGNEWFYHLAPVVRRLLNSPEPDYTAIARTVSSRVLDLLDRELQALADEGRERVMAMLWDQFAARLVA